MKINYKDRTRAKQAGIHYNIYSYKLKALDALNLLDDLRDEWVDKLYADSNHAQVRENIKTIESWRKSYLKRLLGEM